MIIAQRFNAGIMAIQAKTESRAGTKEPLRAEDVSSVPDGTCFLLSQDPALKRWAIAGRKGAKQLQETFPHADQVGKFTVFTIGGNKVRLIAAVHYNRNKIYIRHVLTHQEYDTGKWKK